MISSLPVGNFAAQMPGLPTFPEILTDRVPTHWNLPSIPVMTLP
jgi:hypothetical protein